LQHIMEEDGYEVELVSGITSFCAAAARLGISLTEWNEPLHVIPASHRTGEPLDLPGTYVLMKSASHMRETKELLIASGREVCCVENCGMENEKIYRSAQEIPDDAGYFSLVIAKENNNREKT
ncbi:MAG: precorrin-2 C(20)-methyltransferase, partial [Lachnospiraceae bacterium]|nr:precorrin-2 C(20)-methyltransferase [Lachnospiraceae bacterium]